MKHADIILITITFENGMYEILYYNAQYVVVMRKYVERITLELEQSLERLYHNARIKKDY